jgi:hypothetical protein
MTKTEPIFPRTNLTRAQPKIITITNPTTLNHLPTTRVQAVHKTKPPLPPQTNHQAAHKPKPNSQNPKPWNLQIQR